MSYLYFMGINGLNETNISLYILWPKQTYNWAETYSWPKWTWTKTTMIGRKRPYFGRNGFWDEMANSRVVQG